VITACTATTGARGLGARQAALYAAEAESIEGAGVTWARLADAQRDLDRLVASEWFAERWPHFGRATVRRRGRGATWSLGLPLDHAGPRATATEGVILVAGPLRQPVVLHELAHLLVPDGDGHGPEFAETLLTLVRAEMGFPAFAELYYALRRRAPFARIKEAVASPA
jgi:putative metallohydrolase (TIGR04338 family)